MLVAGAAVASLGGESLETIDDERTVWQSALGAAFVGTSATTMAASLWVIVVSSTLITLSQQSVLQGHSSAEVSRVDAILSRKVADVRLFYTASIFMLLVSSLLMVWINQTLLNGLITTATPAVAEFLHAASTPPESCSSGRDAVAVDTGSGRARAEGLADGGSRGSSIESDGRPGPGYELTRERLRFLHAVLERRHGQLAAALPPEVGGAWPYVLTTARCVKCTLMAS